MYNTHSLTHSLTHSHALTHSLTHSHALTHSTNTCIHTHSLPPSFPPSLPPSHPPSPSLSLSLTLSLPLSPSLPPTLSLSLTLSHPHTTQISKRTISASIYIHTATHIYHNSLPTHYTSHEREVGGRTESNVSRIGSGRSL